MAVVGLTALSSDPRYEVPEGGLISLLYLEEGNSEGREGDGYFQSQASC